MKSILEDLAAGRIDPTEAARRIDRISAAGSGPTAAPGDSVHAGESADADDSGAESVDAWAVSTDRPQTTGVVTEVVGDTVSDTLDDTISETAGRDRADVRGKRGGPQVRVTSGNSVERISVRAIGRRVRIIGEPSVATVSADGPHVLRRNGSVLEISSDGELGASIDGYQILRGAPRSLEDFRALGLGKELLLKVNPAILVDVEVTAGSLHTERMPRLGNVRITAGGATLLDVTQIADALVQAGQATIKGTITQGRSRVRAESGTVSIQLSDDSDVTVTSEAQLGKVTWGGRHTGSGDEVVMGEGRGTLAVEVLMGHVTVKVGSDAATAEAGSRSGR